MVELSRSGMTLEDPGQISLLQNTGAWTKWEEANRDEVRLEKLRRYVFLRRIRLDRIYSHNHRFDM